MGALRLSSGQATSAPPHTMATGSSSGGLLHQMRSSGIGHLLAARFLQITSLLICYPYLPTLTTDLFASAAAGHKMDCAGFSPNNTPAVCVDAHASVVSYSAVAGVVSSGVVSVFLTPILGKFSDLHGRKPVILLGFYTTLPSLLAVRFDWTRATLCSSPLTRVLASVPSCFSRHRDMLPWLHSFVCPRYLTVSPRWQRARPMLRISYLRPLAQQPLGWSPLLCPPRCFWAPPCRVSFHRPLWRWRLRSSVSPSQVCGCRLLCLRA